MLVPAQKIVSLPCLEGHFFFKRQSEIKTMLTFTGVYAIMSEIAVCRSLTTGKLYLPTILDRVELETSSLCYFYSVFICLFYSFRDLVGAWDYMDTLYKIIYVVSLFIYYRLSKNCMHVIILCCILATS